MNSYKDRVQTVLRSVFLNVFQQILTPTYIRIVLKMYSKSVIFMFFQPGLAPTHIRIVSKACSEVCVFHVFQSVLESTHMIFPNTNRVGTTKCSNRHAKTCSKFICAYCNPTSHLTLFKNFSQSQILHKVLFFTGL